MAEELLGTTARSDAELITAVRVGETAAYEELYRRHVDAAMSVARHLTSSKADAEDVVSEAFARILSALQRGVGPEMAFRPYLLTSVRNAFYDRTRKDKRLEVTDDVPEDLGQVLAAAAATDNDAERRLVVTAYASLPERWQLVLWHTEVEGRTPAEVGPLLGLAPNAVAALAYRAREGLRQAYLNAHIQARPPAACAELVPKLGAYVRDDLSNRDRTKVEEHLAGCERCQAIVAELQEAGSRLKIALLPIIAGVPAVAYLSGIGAGGGLAAGVIRAGQRFKELGPAGQVAAVAGAVVVAGSLVVGALAITQGLGNRHPGNEAAVSAPPTNGVSQPGGTSPAGGGGGSLVPGPTEASPTTVPSIAPTPPSATTTPGPASSVSPTPAPATTTGPTSPTTRPTTPTTAVPTTAAPPPADLTFAIGTAGPVYAGQQAALPVSVGNGAPVAAAAADSVIAGGPGQSLAVPESAVVPDQAGPANAPVVLVPLPTGVSFGSVDNPDWACTATAADLQCALPALAPGQTSAAIIQLAVAANAPPSITLQAFVSDGDEPAVAGPPLVITVQPAPAGVSDVIIDKADLALLGNAILTCDPAVIANNCATARDDPAAALPQADKSKQQMIWLDVDADPTTFNSSSATLALPAGAEVLTARLLWGGTVQQGAGGIPPPDVKAIGTVLLFAPGSPSATPVTSTTISPDPTAPARYVASADVTALVGAAGAGTYTLANLQVATGPNAFGGWAMQVVYRDPAAPIRMVALAEDVVTLNAGQSATINLNGLDPSDATRDGALTFAAFEGDYGILPEQLAVNGQPVSNAGNAVNNPLNGSITTPGDRLPAYVNNFGFDADQFAFSVAPGQSSVSVGVSTQKDRFRLTAVAVVVPV